MQPRRLLSDTVMTVVPKLAGGGLTLLLGLLLVGHLPVADYGHYALAITVIFLTDAIGGTPFDLAVMRLGQSGRGGGDGSVPAVAAVEETALAMKLLAAAVAGGGALLGAVIFGSDGKGVALVALTAVAATGLLVLRSTLLRAQMQQRFGAYGGAELAHVTLKLGPAFGLAITQSGGVAGILACLALGPFLALGLIGALSRGLIVIPRLDRAAALGLVRLVRWYGPTLALGATLARLDILVLSALAAPEVVGVYGAASVIASVPDMLGMYMGIVLTPTVLALARQGRLRPWFLRMQLALSVLAATILTAAALALWAGAAHALPSGYQAVVPVLGLLLPGSVLAMTTSALSLSLVMIAREGWMLRLDAVVAPLALTGYVVAVPLIGAPGAAMVALAVTLLRSLAVLRAAWRLSATARNFAP